MKQWLKMGNISGGDAYLGLLSKGDDLAIEKDIKEEYYIHNVHPFVPIDPKVAAGGSITLPFKSEDGLDELLYAFFGVVTTTDNGDGSYTHKFTIKDDALPEFEVIKSLGNIQEKYEGCKVKSIKLSAKGNGEVEAEVEIVSKTGLSVTGEVEGSYSLSETFSIKQAIITWGASEYGIIGVDIALERDLDEGGFLLNSDAGRSEIPEGNFKGSVKLDVVADDVIFLQDFLAGNSKALVLHLETASGAIFEVTLPSALITSRAKSTEVDKKLIIEGVEVVGLYDATDGSVIVNLTNSIAAYPRT